MRDPFQLEGHELFASASVGLSLFPEDGEDSATLQKHADLAMYEAKNRGRNRFQRFAREMNAASSERLEIENQLHGAAQRGELQLYYQPQFRLPSRQLGGWRRCCAGTIRSGVWSCRAASCRWPKRAD